MDVLIVLLCQATCFCVSDFLDVYSAHFQSYRLYKNLGNLDLSWSVFSHPVPQPGVVSLKATE